MTEQHEERAVEDALKIDFALAADVLIHISHVDGSRLKRGWEAMQKEIAALRGRVEELTKERDEALSGEHGNATELAALRKEYLCRQCHGSGVVHDPESGADYCEACVVGREMGQQAEVEEYAGLADRLGRLLTGVANGLKGGPGPLTLHDWSDLPKVSAALRERARVAEEERDQAIAQRDAAIVERDGARQASAAWAADMVSAANRASQRDDEYPLAAILRVIAERDALLEALGRDGQYLKTEPTEEEKRIEGLEYRGKSVWAWWAKAHAYGCMVHGINPILGAREGEHTNDAARRVVGERDEARGVLERIGAVLGDTDHAR